MAKVDTLFSPATQGFLFPNRFEVHLPFHFTLPLLGEIDLRNLVFGLCGGMCATALDYFHQGLPRPDIAQVERLDQKMLVYLCERQLDSLSIPVIVKFIEWMMLEDQEVAQRTARSEVPKLLRALDSAKPSVLGLVRVQGAGNPTNNHQVLATAYDLDSATKDLTIHLYDPNHPGEAPSLRLNLAHPKAGINLVQTSGEGLRGFFMVPYRPQAAL